MSGVSSISSPKPGNVRMTAMGIILSRIVFSPRLVRVFASTMAISGW